MNTINRRQIEKLIKLVKQNEKKNGDDKITIMFLKGNIARIEHSQKV